MCRIKFNWFNLVDWYREYDTSTEWNSIGTQHLLVDFVYEEDDLFNFDLEIGND